MLKVAVCAMLLYCYLLFPVKAICKLLLAVVMPHMASGGSHINGRLDACRQQRGSAEDRSELR